MKQNSVIHSHVSVATSDVQMSAAFAIFFACACCVCVENKTINMEPEPPEIVGWKGDWLVDCLVGLEVWLVGWLGENIAWEGKVVG